MFELSVIIYNNLPLKLFIYKYTFYLEGDNSCIIIPNIIGLHNFSICLFTTDIYGDLGKLTSNGLKYVYPTWIITI